MNGNRHVKFLGCDYLLEQRCVKLTILVLTKLILINLLFSVPSVNVATIEKSACVQDGVSRSRHALLNGDTKNYDWDSGYTCHQLGSGAIVVQLGQPFVIDSMK